MWGLAGILVPKILRIGWYLRTQKFYREGFVMHISHLVSTPLLVLVAVLLFSLVKLNITLAGGNELTVDLSEPSIMVAVSFLLGTVPWPLWNFVQDPALLWLECHGAAHGFEPDSSPYEFGDFITEKAQQFEKWLAEMALRGSQHLSCESADSGPHTSSRLGGVRSQ